jgi:CrcB protein
MKQVLLVFIGGGFGSVARFLIGKMLNNSTHQFPYGTFIANVLGSLLIGFILGWALISEALSQNHTLLLATGFCGGFTTFSSFAYENHAFLKAGDFMNFGLYTIASFVVGFLAVFLGMYLVKIVA